MEIGYLSVRRRILNKYAKNNAIFDKKGSENPDISIEKSADVKDIEIYQKFNKEVSKRQICSVFR